jgi:hypothetical protein
LHGLSSTIPQKPKVRPFAGRFPQGFVGTMLQERLAAYKRVRLANVRAGGAFREGATAAAWPAVAYRALFCRAAQMRYEAAAASARPTRV